MSGLSDMSDLSVALQHDIATGLFLQNSKDPKPRRQAKQDRLSCVSAQDLAAEFAEFRGLEAQCGGSGSAIVQEARRLGKLYVSDAQQWLSAALAAQPGKSKRVVAQWNANMDNVCETRRQTVAYIQAHEYDKNDKQSIPGLVNVRAYYTVLDAADLALSLLVAQALNVTHSFDEHDVQWAPYQLRKLETNNQWNSMYLDEDVYQQACAHMTQLTAISTRLANTGEQKSLVRWGSAADALLMHVASRSLVADMQAFPHAVEWAAPYESHVSSFLSLSDVGTARDTRLLLRILRGDKTQRLISRRLFDRCLTAIHFSTDREGDCAFLQSFMEPGKHALVRSVMLGERSEDVASQYAFMRDETVRTGYLTDAKAEVEAELMLAAPVKHKSRKAKY